MLQKPTTPLMFLLLLALPTVTTAVTTRSQALAMEEENSEQTPAQQAWSCLFYIPAITSNWAATGSRTIKGIKMTLIVTATSLGSSITSVATTKIIELITSPGEPSISTLLDKIETLQALATKTKTIFTSLKKKMPKQVLTLLTKREIKAIEEEQGDTVQSLLNYIKQVRSAIDILEEDYDSFFNNVDTHLQETGMEKEEELKIIANQSKKNIKEK
jgi:hypothetical protein